MNTPYAIEKSTLPTYKVVHNGFNRFLEVKMPHETLESQFIKIKFNIPPGLHRDNAEGFYGIALDVYSKNNHGFEIDVAYNDAKLIVAWMVWSIQQV